MHSWRDTLDYSPNTMEGAIQYEKLFNVKTISSCTFGAVFLWKWLQEFFLNIKDVTRNTTQSTTNDTFDKWAQAELSLHSKYEETKDSVHAALCGKSKHFTLGPGIIIFCR